MQDNIIKNRMAGTAEFVAFSKKVCVHRSEAAVKEIPSDWVRCGRPGVLRLWQCGKFGELVVVLQIRKDVGEGLSQIEEKYAGRSCSNCPDFHRTV